MPIIISIIIMMICIFEIPSAEASCVDVDSIASVNFNITDVISIPQGAPVGTVIYSAAVHSEAKVILNNCSYIGFSNKLIIGTYTGQSISTSEVNSTNITGVGYALSLNDFVNDPKNLAYFSSNMGYNINKEWTLDYMGLSDYYLRLVVTKQNPAQGSLSSGLYGTRKINDTYSSDPESTMANIYINGGNVTSVCAVNDANISVPMGTVYDSQFSGPGSNSEEKGFSVNVNCPANSNVYVTMGGTSDADITDGSVLELTPGEGNATGIGAQILYDHTPLKLNEKLFMKKAAGGDESLQFSARYIQTKPSITPGHANATGTLTITYE